MKEGAPKFKAENPESEMPLEERIEKAQQNYEVIKQYTYGQEVNREEYEELRIASNQLTEDLKNIPWCHRRSNGLPWNPREAMEMSASEISEAIKDK